MLQLFSGFPQLMDEILDDMLYTVSTKKGPEAIHTEIELAGVKKDQVKVTVEEGFLRINVDNPRKKGSRIISLCKNHDLDKATITFEDGLLIVDIPLKKLEKKEARTLEIK